MKTRKMISLLLASVMISAALLTSCGKKSGLTVGEYEVPYDVVRYLAVNIRGDIENEYGEDVWTSSEADEAKEKLEDEVLDYIKELYSVVTLAEEYGISAEDEDISERLEAEKKLYVDSLGDEKKYKEELKNQRLTEDAYEFITVNSILQEEVYYALTDREIGDGTLEALAPVFADNAVRIRQIVIPSSIDGARGAAEDAARRASAGEDFEALIDEYRDMRLENSSEYISEDAIIFRGIVHRSLEDAALSLADGETSGVIETDGAYVIIKRYPMDKDFIASHFDEMKESYQESLMYIALEEQKEKLDVGRSEDFEKLDLTKID